MYTLSYAHNKLAIGTDERTVAYSNVMLLNNTYDFTDQTTMPCSAPHSVQIVTLLKI